MIIPIGHEESEVRRWPWVSFGIMALCLLALLATNGDANDPKWEEGASTFEDAGAYWRDHAYLDASPRVQAEVAHDVSPNQREAYLALIQDQAQAWAPDDPDQVAAEQTELDELTHAALEDGGGVPAEHPYRRWGFTPSDPGPVTLVTHMFVHAGWLHLIGNLFLLLLAGPPIEDRYGRVMFAGFYALSGVFAALFFCAQARDGPTSRWSARRARSRACSAPSLVRFLRTQIRFAYFFRRSGFAPAAGARSRRPPGRCSRSGSRTSCSRRWICGLRRRLGGGVAYWAHVGGFAVRRRRRARGAPRRASRSASSTRRSRPR